MVNLGVLRIIIASWIEYVFVFCFIALNTNLETFTMLSIPDWRYSKQLPFAFRYAAESLLSLTTLSVAYRSPTTASRKTQSCWTITWFLIVYKPTVSYSYRFLATTASTAATTEFLSVARTQRHCLEIFEHCVALWRITYSGVSLKLLQIYVATRHPSIYLCRETRFSCKLSRVHLVVLRAERPFYWERAVTTTTETIRLVP